MPVIRLLGDPMRFEKLLMVAKLTGIFFVHVAPYNYKR